MTKLPFSGPLLPLLAPLNTARLPFLSSLSSSYLPPLSFSGFLAMLSTFPAMSTVDGLFGIPLPAFEGNFTPWDSQEPFFDFQLEEPITPSKKLQEPVISNSGLNNSNPKSIGSSSSSGSDDPKREAPVVDERKKRRMISNRESARRSRMRKQKHLENMRNQMNRLRIGNRDLMNRLSLVTQHCQLVRRDNERLRLESISLQQKLWDMHQILLVRQLQQHFSSPEWPFNTTVVPVNEQTPPPPSLITKLNHNKDL